MNRYPVTLCADVFMPLDNKLQSLSFVKLLISVRSQYGKNHKPFV